MTKLLQINNQLNLNFRVAEPADTETIVAIVESAYRGQVSRQGWTTEADFLEGQRTDQAEVSGLMQKADSVFLLAEAEAMLLASVQLEKQAESAYLGMFAVRPEYQASGVGRQLLAAAERWCQQNWNSLSVQMTVITIREELIDWYLRRGYSRSGHFKPFPYGQPRFGLPLRDDLELEVLYKALPAAVY